MNTMQFADGTSSWVIVQTCTGLFDQVIRARVHHHFNTIKILCRTILTLMMLHNTYFLPNRFYCVISINLQSTFLHKNPSQRRFRATYEFHKYQRFYRKTKNFYPLCRFYRTHIILFRYLCKPQTPLNGMSKCIHH